MVEAEVFYAKDNRWMLETYKDHPDVPTEDEFKKEYARIPIKFNINDGTEKELNSIFHKLNVDNNPMGTKMRQNWIRANGLKHTSMSVGDIVLVNKKNLFMCADFGWTKIPWTYNSDKKEGFKIEGKDIHKKQPTHKGLDAECEE
jgi:hypothetical protein